MSKTKLVVLTDTGAPYYGFQNDRQAESDETNNTRTIESPFLKTNADLVISDFKILDPNPTWGQPATVSWTVTNQGAATANRDWYDHIWISADGVIDGYNDTFLGQYYTSDPLAAGASYTKTATINIPYDLSKTKLVVLTDTGAPYYGFQNDRQAESDETNNTRTIESPFVKPDLAITDFKILTPNPTWGQQGVEVSWTVTNQGAATANRDWYDHIWISADGVIDGYNDTFLGQYYTSDPLAAGASYTKTATINIPYDLSKTKLVVLTDTGAPYYGFQNDRQVESDDSNNTKSVTISVTTPNPNLPDLSVTSLTLPSTTTWGEKVAISWTVKNQGSYATTSSWSDYLYASDDPNFDINDTFIGFANSSTSSLASGASYTTNQDFTIPFNATGKRYVIVVANRDRQQSETLTNNNIYALDILGSPDLTITGANAPGNTTWGEIKVPVSWTVKNQGSHNAVGTWYDAVYISDDDILDVNDAAIVQVPQNQTPLNAGESYTINLNIDIPANAWGKKYLIFSTNRYNDRLETNTNNNFKAVKIGGEPDLVVSQVSVPSNTTWGNTVPVSWTVTNRGNAPALVVNWSDYIYASSDNKLDSSDVLVSYSQFDNQNRLLGAGESYTVNKTVTIPTYAAGKPYLLFITDRSNYQRESDETNNINSFVINASDLAVTNLTAPTTATWGATIPVSWTVTNQGGLATSGTWTDGIYLSNNSTFDNTAVLVGQTTSGATSIAGGASYTQSANITLPTNFTGQPYLFVVSNSQKQLLEAGYDNNIKGLALNIQASDLVVTNFNTPPTITPGQLVNLSWTVKNQGTYKTDTNWRDRVYLSIDALVSNDDLLLADLGVTNILQIGDTYTLTTQATLPQFDPTKTWKLLIKTDANSNQAEVIESNNISVNNVAITAPDLVLTAATVPTQASVNGTVDLTWTVKNQGTGSALGSWNDAVYLSNDDKFDSGDILLGSKLATQQLTPNNSYTATQTITLPSQVAGNKYLIIRTNSTGTQSETDPTNNYRILPIAIAAPDLTISNLTTPTLAQLGDKVSVTWKVTNNSLLNAVTGWNDGIYISKDNVLDSSDTLLATVSKSNLNGGSNYTGTADITIPDLAPGNYYLIAKTDKDLQQLETDETNNTTFAPIQLVYPPSSDLVVDTILPPVIGTSGEAISLTWRVSNQGQLATNSNTWSDRVYISKSATFDNTAIAIGTADRTGKLNAGDNYLQTATFTLPNAISGNYYFFVTTDINNQVNEYKFEGNNTTGSTGSAAITRKPDPDLVVSNLTYASTGQPGQTITVNWTVNNTGLGVAKGNWSDRVYLTNASWYD